MPGPIETAFVEIVARLEVGDMEDELTGAIRRAVTRAEPIFKRLEKQGVETAQAVGAAFRRLDVEVNVRDALKSMASIEDKAINVGAELKKLARLTVSIGSDVAVAQFDKLKEELVSLQAEIRRVDEENLEPNFAGFEQELRQLLLRLQNVQEAVKALNSKQVDVKDEAAVTALENLGKQIGDALRKVEQLNGQEIKVDVNDIDIATMIENLKLAERQVRELDALNPEIKIKVDKEGLSQNVVVAAEAAARRGADKFAGVFRRSLEFGFVALITRDLAQVVGQFFRAGLQAAGDIQTAQVAINRFFTQTRDLGETSVGFFKDLRKLAIETPFEFPDLANTSRRILAMGLDANQAKDALNGIADAVASVGGGSDEINGVVKALSQITSKGKVDLQDLRQISERLPSLSRQMQIQGIIDEFNRLHPTIHATIADFNDLRKSGAITGQIVRDGIINAIKEVPGAAGAARAAAATIQGSLTNLADFAKFQFADSFAGLGRILAGSLNEAFASLDSTEVKLNSLAGAIGRVIDVGGRAGEDLFPQLLSSVIELAPAVEKVVGSVEEFAKQAIPALTSATKGAITGMSGLLSVATSVLGLFNALPKGLQETVANVLILAKVIPGAGEALILPFKLIPGTLKLIQAELKATEDFAAGTISEAQRAEQEMQTAEQKAALGASVLKAGIALGALVLFDQFSRAAADAQERIAAFGRGVKFVATEFDSFTTAGEAAVDIVKKFNDEANKIPVIPNLIDTATAVGNVQLKNPFAGGNQIQPLTSQQLAEQLGLTQDQLSKVSLAFAEFDASTNQGNGDVNALSAALKAAGTNMDNITAASSNAQGNLFSLAKVMSEGAKVTVENALSTKEFALASDQAVRAIQIQAEITGNWIGAQDQLKRAQEDGAKAAFDQLSVEKLSAKERDKIITQFTSYTAAADGSVTSTVDWTGALQEVNKEAAVTATVFESLQGDLEGFSLSFNLLTDGLGNTNLEFVKFAEGAKKAGFGVDEFNAVADQLGATLGRALTGGELQKVSEAVVAQVDAFKTALEAVVPGIADLQGAANSFTLDSFIAELEKVAVARANVVGNMQKLIDQFGDLGAKAIAALANSGLNKDQFAAVLQGAMDGGEQKLKEIVFAFGAATSTSLDDVAAELTAHGLTQDEISTILGEDAFKTSTGNIEGYVAGLRTSMQTELGKLQALSFTADPRWKGELQNEIGDLQAQLGGTFDTTTPALPQIDTEKAVASATDSGTQVASAFQGSVTTGVSAAMATVDTTITTAIGSTGNAASVLAFVQGTAVGAQLSKGFTLAALGISGALTADIALAQVSGSIAAEVAGGQLGTVMETGFVDALDPLSADAGAKLNQTLTDLSGFTSTFEGLGAELGARFSNALVGAFQGVTVGVTAALNGVLALLGILNLSFYARGISLGTSLGQGLIDGVNSKLAQAYAAGAGVAAQAEAGARDTSKSHSPSQVFDDIGQDLVAGLVRGVKSSMSQSTSVMAQAINQMADAGSPQPLADSIAAVFNTLIYRINNAFLLLAGRLGVSEIFAGSPVRQFAQGVVATSPTFGRFAEAGPEAILPLGDGAAAARIIAQLVPYIGAQGRAAAADLLGLSDSSPGRADGAGGSTWHNEWNVTVPTDDPELFARRAAARLERRMTR